MTKKINKNELEKYKCIETDADGKFLVKIKHNNIDFALVYIEINSLTYSVTEGNSVKFDIQQVSIINEDRFI